MCELVAVYNLVFFADMIDDHWATSTIIKLHNNVIEKLPRRSENEDEIRRNFQILEVALKEEHGEAHFPLLFAEVVYELLKACTEFTVAQRITNETLATINFDPLINEHDFWSMLGTLLYTIHIVKRRESDNDKSESELKKAFLSAVFLASHNNDGAWLALIAEVFRSPESGPAIKNKIFRLVSKKFVILASDVAIQFLRLSIATGWNIENAFYDISLDSIEQITPAKLNYFEEICEMLVKNGATALKAFVKYSSRASDTSE